MGHFTFPRGGRNQIYASHSRNGPYSLASMRYDLPGLYRNKDTAMVFGCAPKPFDFDFPTIFLLGQQQRGVEVEKVMTMIPESISFGRSKLDEEDHHPVKKHSLSSSKRGVQDFSLEGGSLHSLSLRSLLKSSQHGPQGDLGDRFAALSIKGDILYPAKMSLHDSFGTAATTPLQDDESSTECSFCHFDDSLSSVEEEEESLYQDDYESEDEGIFPMGHIVFQTPETKFMDATHNLGLEPGSKRKLRFSHDDWSNFRDSLPLAL